ncbi:MAG: hypothetical protein KF778_20925 [Rhodocyclaceae bacterium]|nr:hypothetical protein [Rhodocyclaceae bacterium]MBX3670870.1 hypothetical protein [Rhodocyclaceae bacterium]
MLDALLRETGQRGKKTEEKKNREEDTAFNILLGQENSQKNRHFQSG